MVNQNLPLCQRCGFGIEKPGTEIRRFAEDDQWWQLLLCEQHAVLYDRERGIWTRLAEEIEGAQPAPPASRIFNSEAVREENRRIAELRAKQAAPPVPAATKFLDQRQAQLDAESTTTDPEEWRHQEQQIRAAIPGSSAWHITNHAHERMLERHIGLAAVLMTVTEPEISYTSEYNGQPVFVQRRGTCHVVVDRTSKNVLTVAHSNLTELKNPATTPIERTAL